MVDIAGVVVNPILEVGKWLAAPIWRQFKYMLNYKTNFDNLQKEVNNLKNARDGIQHGVTAAERNVEEIEQNVKDWQKNVEETITKAEQLIQAKANNPRCFKGLCPIFIIHYKQSRKAFKLKRDDIDPLLQQGEKLGPISYQTNPPDRRLRPNEDYLAFESRNSTVKNVWDALNNENVFMMGVYGMGGLGKTTLVQELGRKAKEEKLFEEIVFVEVSESPDVEKIQTTIAKKLGLKFENENESEMGDKIYSRMKDKNILLILDNIWEPLELDKTVGIPRRADRGRNKFLFTTRNLDVLERMGSTNNFRMGILNEEEAWTLFSKMAALTDNVIQTCRLHSLQNDVCKECGGVPIVICTIGRALIGKTEPFDWEDVLQDLRAPSPTNFTDLLKEEYRKIELSYRYLRNDELKKTFLIASLLENNTSILDLFKHVVCQDILEGANLTMENARNKLDRVVRELKYACLLLDGVESGQFAMHDVVRVVAITIANVNHHVFTARNDVERDWKDRDKLKKCTKISLTGKNTIIRQLWPTDLACPNLEYFYMIVMWNSSFEIPEDFFRVMPKLRVLNLVGLQRWSLPSSIHHLTNLQTLCLDYSNIGGVPIIGKLKKLKVLSLRNSYIKEFPTEMGQLTQLRLLDLSDCCFLEVIAPNVISKLSQLEELYLKKCPIQWKIEVLEELKLLLNLTNVELDIKDDKVLPEAFFSKELIRYKISVGDWWYANPTIGEQECLTILKLIYNSTIYLEELYGIKNVEILCLAEYLDDRGHSKFSLQSNEITPLFNKKVIFSDLKVLVLNNIISRKIWDNELPSSSFQNLKELMLWSCARIKYVFPYTITKNLYQLQHLHIRDCIDLEEIVGTEEITEAAASFVFPQVTVIELEHLPKLATFHHGIHTSEWPKLKKLVMICCDKFKLFNSESNSSCLDEKVHFRDLEVLYLNNISFEKICDNQLSTSSYQNLTHLTLFECDKIKYVFPLSIAKSLQQLQNLELDSCKVLERIVAPEEGTEVAINFFFPQVSTVKLQYLPEFIDFYSGIHTSEWPKLKELVIEDCLKFKMFTSEPNSLCLDQKINHDLEEFKLKTQSTVISWNRENKALKISSDKSANIPLQLLQRFESLKELQLYGCEYKEIKSVFDLPNLNVLHVEECSKLVSLVPPSTSLQNLKVLMVSGCNELINLTTPSTARSLVQLKELSILDCGMLDEILENKRDVTTIEIVFEKLTKLSLDRLQSLTCFCSGNHSLNFPSLEKLIIIECPNMSTFFREISNVSEFTLQSNEIMPFFNQKIMFSKLKVLELKNISPEKIWDSRLSTSSYQNLTDLILFECDKIKHVFPLSIAKSLQQLQYLELKSCKVLEKIVAPEEGTEATINFFFPQLSTVKLQYLPKFTDFYSGIHTSEWPKLRKLVVKDCGIFKMLTSEPNFLCLDQKINFNLEVFELYDGETNISWQSQSKTFIINNDISTNIPLRLLHRFENVSKLRLSSSQYKDIKSLCDLPNLEILEVFCSSGLMTLMSFSTSFQNLKVLEVSFCNELLKLITPSMARSLVQLRELSITFCIMLNEIVENEGDATTSTEIVFNNLNKLSLQGLYSLTSFSSGNYSFSFPSLEELIIKCCPSLEIFCQGSLCTPNLDRVIYNDKEVENGENNLNTTIQQEHKKQKELTGSSEGEEEDENLMTSMEDEEALDVLRGRSSVSPKNNLVFSKELSGEKFPSMVTG